MQQKQSKKKKDAKDTAKAKKEYKKRFCWFNKKILLV
jgi:hypothetical protein